MKLVEVDLEGVARHALEAADAKTLAALRAWLSIPREPVVKDVIRLLELAPDEVLGSLADFCDARILAGDVPENVLATIETARAFLAACDYPIDTSALAARLAPKPRSSAPTSATRTEILERLMDDPYTATVVRRLFGIEGIIPTHAFVRDLAALDLRPEDEPRVARLIASLGKVVDAHREIIEPLRRGLAREERSQ